MLEIFHSGQVSNSQLSKVKAISSKFKPTKYGVDLLNSSVPCFESRRRIFCTYALSLSHSVCVFLLIDATVIFPVTQNQPLSLLCVLIKSYSYFVVPFCA
jgi:hypothetical protein